MYDRYDNEEDKRWEKYNDAIDAIYKFKTHDSIEQMRANKIIIRIAEEKFKGGTLGKIIALEHKLFGVLKKEEMLNNKSNKVFDLMLLEYGDALTGLQSTPGRHFYRRWVLIFKDLSEKLNCLVEYYSDKISYENFEKKYNKVYTLRGLE